MTQHLPGLKYSCENLGIWCVSVALMAKLIGEVFWTARPRISQQKNYLVGEGCVESLRFGKFGSRCFISTGSFSLGFQVPASRFQGLYTFWYILVRQICGHFWEHDLCFFVRLLFQRHCVYRLLLLCWNLQTQLQCGIEFGDHFRAQAPFQRIHVKHLFPWRFHLQIWWKTVLRKKSCKNHFPTWTSSCMPFSILVNYANVAVPFHPVRPCLLCECCSCGTN